MNVGFDELYIFDMTADASNVYIAGYFEWIDGDFASHVARWDGSTWSALGAGIVGVGRSLVEFDGKLYVAGSVNTAGGQPVDYVAAWDGASWSCVGDGLFGGQGMTVFENQLVVVGDFSEAGSKASSCIATYTAETATSVDDAPRFDSSSIRLGLAGPNPTSGPATFRFATDRGVSIRMEVVDLRGRRVLPAAVEGLRAA